MTEDGGNENFLRRWSRRKIEESAPEKDEPQHGSPDDTAPVETIDDEENEDVTADLPNIDSLDKDSDYTVFLRDGVPEELKRLALRKLWLSDPVLANLDGLNDYDDDFATIMKSGADYMQRLARTAEKLTRPESESEDDAADNTESGDGVETDENLAEDDAAGAMQPADEKNRRG